MTILEESATNRAPRLGGPTTNRSLLPVTIAETLASSLYVSDPVEVGGYRLVSRLGSGWMADVVHAVAADGGRLR